MMEPFEYISDASDKVDELIEEAKHIRSRKEKQEKLKEAQKLADAYTAHCKRGGNDKPQFNQIV